MSLETEPIPRAGGGWSSPGLTASFKENPLSISRSRGASPHRRRSEFGSEGSGGRDVDGSSVSWQSAKMKSARVRGEKGQRRPGWVEGSLRKLSANLPYFLRGGIEDRCGEKEKLGRGRNALLDGIVVHGPGGRYIDWKELGRKASTAMTPRRRWLMGTALCIFLILWFGTAPARHWYWRSAALGGGSKFVIILGANEGGGVMDWKGPTDWAIERDSMRNKRRYAERWGYNLHVVDMVIKKKYAHEWREGWEKVDLIRGAMATYPDAEWFWWLDLNTYIMEPSISLQSHIFNSLADTAYRDINIYNPLHIAHPPNISALDSDSLSPTGDNLPSSIDLLITQDCSGFNLGSFFVRRSAWSSRILDAWWDPVFYEQRHMNWEHKEQDALEHIYSTQPWIRSRVGFLPQRKINAFPEGACGDDRGLPKEGCAAALKRVKAAGTSGSPAKTEAEMKADAAILQECGVQGVHYQESERDFLVNMAGCQWGRDCWGEMYDFRELSNWLNRTRWEKFKDWIDGKARRHDAAEREKKERKMKEKKERLREDEKAKSN